MERQSASYNGDTYHLIVKNCNHFCKDICYKLTGKSIPTWVNRLARLGIFCSTCFIQVVVYFLQCVWMEGMEKRRGNERFSCNMRLGGFFNGSGSLILSCLKLNCQSSSAVLPTSFSFFFILKFSSLTIFFSTLVSYWFMTSITLFWTSLGWHEFYAWVLGVSFKSSRYIPGNRSWECIIPLFGTSYTKLFPGIYYMIFPLLIPM